MVSSTRSPLHHLPDYAEFQSVRTIAENVDAVTIPGACNPATLIVVAVPIVTSVPSKMKSASPPKTPNY